VSWSFTDLKYGWKIATGITLSAATIYVANNIRERINQVDEIELDLAIAERCLATQYSTNPVSYYVSPPQYVRSWYSNSYETQVVAGVTSVVAVLYTNVFTNAVGYRTDRAKAVARDATIKALVPYYCDPDTIYDGTTNIVMLTVTGLWASLGIGDRTNQFTRVPEWTGTNGVTNAATYGALPWRIYVTDLQERYKVLNAMQYRMFQKKGIIGQESNFPTVTGNAEIYGSQGNIYYPGGTLIGAAGTYQIKIIQSDYDADPLLSGGFACGWDTEVLNLSPPAPNSFGISLMTTQGFQGHIEFLDNSVKFANQYRILSSAGTNVLFTITPSKVSINAQGASAGTVYRYAAFFPYIKYPFQYCTNKYW